MLQNLLKSLILRRPAFFENYQLFGVKLLQPNFRDKFCWH